MTIAQKQVSFSGLSVNEKVYDGTSEANIAHISADDFNYVDGVAGEKLLIVAKGEGDISGLFSDKNVGEKQNCNSFCGRICIKREYFLQG